MAQPVIIDTDPGQDDAIAILAALSSPELDVLGITTVAGNVPLALTTRNAQLLVELAGRTEVPIVAGAERPMLRKLVTAEAVHGKTGLDGPDWQEPTVELHPGHAVDWLIETLRSATEPVTVCPLGPLTNIGLALSIAPDIVASIDRIVLMGGGWWEGGNITPAAEFNIYVDPHAADVVFRSGLPLVVIPLDVTHKALMRREWIDSIGALGSDVGDACASMLDFYQRFDVEKYGSEGGPLHDPNVIAYLLAPDLYQGREVNVEIEIHSERTMGQTVVDYWGVTGLEPNCRWIDQVDSEGFYSLLSDLLGRY